MRIQAYFLSDSVKIVTDKCTDFYPLGYVTYKIATDDWGNLDNVFGDVNKKELKKFALDMLERCFSTKDNQIKVNAFMQCEEDLSLKYSYSMSMNYPIVSPDGNILCDCCAKSKPRD